MARFKRKGKLSGFSISRLDAFSDGVFAIAITLLVLEISVPENSKDNLLRELLNQWPVYLAYFVSFATIGAAWFSHAAITEHLERADRGLARINLVLLMLVSFLPFPTKLLAQYIGTPGQERVAVTLYGIVLFCITSLLSLLWRHATNNKLIKPSTSDDEINVISARFRPSLYGYLVLIFAGLFVPGIAVAGYLLIAVYIMFPLHIIHRGPKD